MYEFILLYGPSMALLWGSILLLFSQHIIMIRSCALLVVQRVFMPSLLETFYAQSLHDLAFGAKLLVP